ncbi:MAG: hypothetical protein EAZ78_08530 [Oscillatoriales cyanobacterium]|nr:MAG: hypothetical protein EA000_24930 [Oscillatoriales cyanobacterium]TAF04596.1 MAG: hypothetical protein EAZ78_08530 [Oscillatoriales cyanobacterium]TAF46911.1 MAG: hypothetical protein EAZ68_02895 [Oscillatoriales cyanobacterium]TAF64232.1 MAG: hypothetical protein EAZ59_18885 [Oscillatoriales cyanobacterium]
MNDNLIPVRVHNDPHAQAYQFAFMAPIKIGGMIGTAIAGPAGAPIGSAIGAIIGIGAVGNMGGRKSH